MTSPVALYDTREHGFCQVNFSDYREKVADWLNGFNWDWWATFTFRYPCMPYSAKKSFIRNFREQGIDYFYASEWCGDFHGVHIHALMGNCYGIRRLTTMDKWYQRYGIARIYPYDKRLGARYYVCKYIVKSVADWDIRIEKQACLKKLSLSYATTKR
ncbi:hypothetical protein ES705_36749 [subsurface metagenome]